MALARKAPTGCLDAVIGTIGADALERPARWHRWTQTPSLFDQQTRNPVRYSIAAAHVRLHQAIDHECR
jgi:hypothetical protein